MYSKLNNQIKKVKMNINEKLVISTFTNKKKFREKY
jgi:hypothetical protein